MGQKMALSSYKKGLKRLIQMLTPVADHYGKPKLFFWLDALWANIRYGVTPNQYIGFRFCEKSALERSEFYTHRQHKRFEAALNDPKYYDAFWDKEKFNAVFHEFIHRDWLYCADASEEEIRQFLSRHAKVMVKPTSASSGKGVHAYKGETAEELKRQKFLLEEFVIQHPKMMELNPSCVNTVRIYTILDHQKVPHILSASLRVGGANSEVDNFHAGGVAYPLEPAHGVVMSAGRSMLGEDCLYHPGTGAKLIGFEVPKWPDFVQFVFRATQVLPTARMIAWDVAVLENGFEMIEGNYNGDPGLMQSPSGKGKKREILKYM